MTFRNFLSRHYLVDVDVARKEIAGLRHHVLLSVNTIFRRSRRENARNRILAKLRA